MYALILPVLLHFPIKVHRHITLMHLHNITFKKQFLPNLQGSFRFVMKIRAFMKRTCTTKRLQQCTSSLLGWYIFNAVRKKINEMHQHQQRSIVSDQSIVKK